jgi:hypothetical protein
MLLTDHPAGTQQHKPITDPRSIDKLVDRQHQSPPALGVTAQQKHHISCLPKIQPVKRLVQ